jgi:hypothetical protein
MNPRQTRRPRRARDARRPGAALVALLVLAALAAVASGCGGSGSGGTPAAGATPTAIQVMATATRGDLTQSVMGQARVVKEGGKEVVIATIAAQSAPSVAAGQTASVFLFRAGQGGFPRAGASGTPFPQGGAGGTPVPQGSGMPVPQDGASGFPFSQGGQGGFPGGGFGQGDRGGAAGTVTAVKTNADGTAAATISVAKLPSGATTKSTGFARIEVKVLASNVILIPTAAIKGSGSSATVQVVANGKTETRTISVGLRSGAQTEVVSGLNEGENVVYQQSFRGFPGRSGGFPGSRQSGAPFPQQGGQSSGTQSGGSFR